MQRNKWNVGLIVTKSLCSVYSLNVDSVDILMSSMVDGGGVAVAVLYGLATRPKPEIFIRKSVWFPSFFSLKLMTVRDDRKLDQ